MGEKTNDSRKTCERLAQDESLFGWISCEYKLLRLSIVGYGYFVGVTGVTLSGTSIGSSGLLCRYRKYFSMSEVFQYEEMFELQD